jgi:hypothetical protein
MHVQSYSSALYCIKLKTDVQIFKKYIITNKESNIILHE